MRVRALWLTLAVVIAGQATCATGIEPPRATDLVEVTDGLTFEFGQEAICWNRAEMLGPNKDLEPGNCDDGKYIPFIPPTTEVVLKPFAIEQHEVSNFQYEYCVAMGACTPPSGYNAPGPRQQDYYEIDEFDDHPVMFVSKFQAQEYCAFVGRRLPTELEWDRVARGNPNVVAGGKRLVPTDAFSSLEACKGQDVAGTFCGQSADTVPVDQPGDDYVMEGDYKIHHLFSNVAEWTADAYDILRTCKDAMPAECTSVFVFESRSSNMSSTEYEQSPVMLEPSSYFHTEGGSEICPRPGRVLPGSSYEEMPFTLGSSGTYDVDLPSSS